MGSVNNLTYMRFKKPFNITLLILIILLLGFAPTTPIASQLSPNVSAKMEKPEFWIKKVKNPSRILLTSEEIQRMNEENLKRQELFLCRVKDLKEEWKKEEILSLLREDWEGFGKTEEVRYGRNGMPLQEPFWNELKSNLHQESLKERNPLLFGLVVKRTDIRVFPTDERSMSTPTNHEFDRFQHSMVSPGSLIGIYYLSKDKQWAYVQTGFIRGWVRMKDLAIAKEKSEAKHYEETKERLLITGNFVNIFGDPTLQQLVFTAQMGNSFPLISMHGESGTGEPGYVIKIPYRGQDGGLSFRKGYISKDEDVHRGFLPYTQENVAHQAFKMLHQPYGWGEMDGGRDCSRFIMDIFATFGILMPRNSKLQAQVGTPLSQTEGKSLKEKGKILDRAMRIVTLLRSPGHIMLYLGKDHGKYYVIHSIWGIQKSERLSLKLKKIGKVVVSDLSLGNKEPNGSLLDRITDIRIIGPNLEN
jgi:hypothetical protein